jgi:hypothetical protein
MEMKLNMPGAAAQGEAVAAPAAASGATLAVLPEQVVYAQLLDHGMRAGLTMLVLSFFAYVLGVAEPQVPLADLPNYWSMPVGQYLAAAGVGTGWNWLTLAHKGDFMNFLGIAFLSAVTIVCYIRILPLSLKARDPLVIGIVVAEILVLILAASGILAAGH